MNDAPDFEFPEDIVHVFHVIGAGGPDVFDTWAPEAFRYARRLGFREEALQSIVDKLDEIGQRFDWSDDVRAKKIGDAKQYRPEGGEKTSPSNGHADHAIENRRTDGPSTVLVFDRIADVIPAAIDWIWEGRLARRKLTLIAGDPGLGKSQITADVASRISIGANWPDAGRAPSGSTIILSAEDTISDTLRPRLEVAGADLMRIHALRSVRTNDGGRRTFSLQSDLVLLGEKLEQVGDGQLVVIDPITSYMGKIDSHRTTDVRSVLEPVAEFAEEHQIAVLAVTHPPKATQAKALHAITGSLAFVAAARLVFIAVEETDTDRRLLLPVKSNIGALPAGLGYSLVSATTDGGIATSRVEWSSAPVTISANQALHAAAESVKSDGQMREAEDFLRNALANGPALAKSIEKDAADVGITKSTLKRARIRMGVVAKKDGFKGGWTLVMPDSGNE